MANDSRPSPTKRFARVSAGLHRYVERIWGWESDTPVPLPLMLPGTGAELMFHYRAPFAARDADGVFVALPCAGLGCLRNRAREIVATGPVGFISARIRSEALRHFSDLPLAEIVDGFQAVADVLGAAWSDMPARLAGARGFAERAKLLEAALLRHLARRDPRPALSDRAVARLYYEADRVQVGHVADGLNVSARHFERLFGAATGITPKHFQRVARFHHAARRLLLEARNDCLPVALESGFYDQAHFIRECRALTGRTPGEVFTPEHHLSHFYNPSLRP